MRWLSVVVTAVVVMCVCSGAPGVQVKVGDMNFPLEAVKQLKSLMDVGAGVSPRLADTSVAVACGNPLLPQVFLPVCQSKGTGMIFSRLVYITTPTDPCEICANPSCFGCLN